MKQKFSNFGLVLNLSRKNESLFNKSRKQTDNHNRYEI